jgi:hypothetical protein
MPGFSFQFRPHVDALAHRTWRSGRGLAKRFQVWPNRKSMLKTPSPGLAGLSFSVSERTFIDLVERAFINFTNV